MAGTRGDDPILRRLRHAAAIVAIASLGLLVLNFVIRDRAPDGALLVVVVVSMLILLGLLAPTVMTDWLGIRRAPPAPPDPPAKDGE